MASHAFFIPITLTIHKSDFEDSLSEETVRSSFMGFLYPLEELQRIYLFQSEMEITE
jgi:hypothetical protein